MKVRQIDFSLRFNLNYLPYNFYWNSLTFYSKTCRLSNESQLLNKDYAAPA